MMIDCENLIKIYKTPDLEVVALQGLDLSVEEGELIAIVGNSGSGKSTLLNMLGGLDKPSAGRLFVAGQDMLKVQGRALQRYKKETVGFIWQNNARNLVPYLTALENVELPMTLVGRVDHERALMLLDLVGLSHRRRNRLNALSGGEQQRVALAIALANNPRLLLADEPTGAVDSAMAKKLMELFDEMRRTLGVTVVIVTHDQQLTRFVDRVVAIRDGRTSSEIVSQSVSAELADGFQEEQPVELAVVDRAGRLQIPREYLDSLGIHNRSRVRVELEDGKVVLYPAPQAAGEKEAGLAEDERSS